MQTNSLEILSSEPSRRGHPQLGRGLRQCAARASTLSAVLARYGLTAPGETVCWNFSQMLCNFNRARDLKRRAPGRPCRGARSRGGGTRRPPWDTITANLAARRPSGRGWVARHRRGARGFARARAPVGWPRRRRPLREQTRDHVIVLAQGHAGRWPRADDARLVGVQRNDGPPTLGSRPQGLAQ